MPHYLLNELPEREVVPGFHGRFVHGENFTVANWRIEQDAILPEHSHPHEQATQVLLGELEITMGGTIYRLTPGQVLVIPGGVAHSGRAISPCEVVDVFQPARDDYR
jgi:quercetin dioxygenase-like cupin family protein